MGRPTAGYRLADGTRVPGVTTIIGRFKDSGALLHWAFAQGQAAQRGEISSLYDKRDQAADAGTLAHDLVEARIRKTPPPVVPDDETGGMAMQAYENYLRWERSNNIRIVDTEMPLVSEVHRFGGTPDAIGEIDGKLCVLDWKTSNGVYQDYLIQLAAYKWLIEERTDHKITGGFHLCRFSKEHADFSHHYWSELNEAWELFLIYRRALDIDKRLKKRAA